MAFRSVSFFVVACFAMAGFMESEAVFAHRLQSLGLADCKDRLAENHVKTWGDMAFACAYVPGQSDEAPLIAFGKKLLGDTLPKFPTFRRLMFEAYTHMTSDLRSQTERSSEDKPKKLSLPERNARREKIKQKLVGVGLQRDAQRLACPH